jgi:hypothetical protein
VPSRTFLLVRRSGYLRQQGERDVGGVSVPRLSREREGLLRVSGGLRVIAPIEGRDRQMIHGMGGRPHVSLLPNHLQRLLKDPCRPVEVAQLQRDVA